jgi:alpha-amylase
MHNHQPVGNFDWVFEKAYQLSYKPFMEVMLAHPKLKWSMHATGMLWEFFMKNHPGYIKNVKQMVSSGRLELLTGGYYEPILSAIPDRDKVGQVKKLTKFLKDTFNYEAKGFWFAERVWEPHLAKHLSECGIEFIVLDDAHFSSVGLDPETLKGYYTTEDSGNTVNIFPISQTLRYMIPFQNVENSVNYFKHLSQTQTNPVAVLADDGEKFGLWPGTNKHVYENKWLENFVSAIEANADYVEMSHFADVLKLQKSSGRVYLPCASYFEMSEWTLPSGAQLEFENLHHRYNADNMLKRFLKGSFWRSFLVKYEESNNMHKKMLRVSEKVEKYLKAQKPLSDRITQHLYAGQCNCAYWHGVFGGLYLPHLRNAIYKELLKAENIYNKYFLKVPKWVEEDFDKDCSDELLFESKTQNIYVSPHFGGAIFEFDSLGHNYNLTNVLTRRFEAYHKKLKDNAHNAVLSGEDDSGVKTIHDENVKVKEKGLEHYLVYDGYRRASLIDHFFDENTAAEHFSSASFKERGDFAGGEYNYKIDGKKLILWRTGKVYTDNSAFDVKITKVITPLGDIGYETEYTLENMSENALKIKFATEQVFAFSCKTVSDTASIENATSWARIDEGFGFSAEISTSVPCDFWITPIETVANSEDGYERTYQGTAAVSLIKVDIAGAGSVKFKITTRIK